MHLVAGVNPVACGRPAEIADGRFGANLAVELAVARMTVLGR